MFTRIQQKQSKQQCYEKFEASLRVERTILVLTQGGQTVREVLPTLVSQAPISLVERKEKSGPTVEAQDEE